jgi:hypothetical protein
VSAATWRCMSIWTRSSTRPGNSVAGGLSPGLVATPGRDFHHPSDGSKGSPVPSTRGCPAPLLEFLQKYLFDERKRTLSPLPTPPGIRTYPTPDGGLISTRNGVRTMPSASGHDLRLPVSAQTGE